jgi:hypothetical protein
MEVIHGLIIAAAWFMYELGGWINAAELAAFVLIVATSASMLISGE